MKFLLWLLRLLVFALALMFSVRNTTPVTLYGLPGMQLNAPLVVVLLVAFIVGAVFAWGCLLPSWLRARRAAHDVRHALAASPQQSQAQPLYAPAVSAANTPVTTATAVHVDAAQTNASGGAGHGV